MPRSASLGLGQRPFQAHRDQARGERPAAAVTALPMAITMHNGVNSRVSQRPNGVSVTRLKRPTYRKSPMARSANSDASTHDPQAGHGDGTGSHTTPPCTNSVS